MMDWLRRLLQRAAGSRVSRTDSAQAHPLCLAFDSFLATRLENLRPQLTALFDAFDVEALPPGLTHLHIEVFDDAGYELRLHGFDSDQVEVFLAPSDTSATRSELRRVNDALKGLQPFVTPDEMRRFLIWEEHPHFGAQEALEQPLDSYNAWVRLGPCLAQATQGLRARFAGDVTTGLHDRPARPITEGSRSRSDPA